MSGHQQDYRRRHDATGADGSPKSLMVVKATSRMQMLVAAVGHAFRYVLDLLQRTPLAYKLSFFITVLVVSCMVLLGVIIVQQQTQVLQNQINEQGSTLVRLMAKAAREPLLADDKLALDGITSGFASNSIIGTAIASLGCGIPRATSTAPSLPAASPVLENRTCASGDTPSVGCTLP